MEDLAYRRLLDLYYLNEQPLSGCVTDVAREIGLVEQVDSVSYVLSKFFTFDDGVYFQKRIESEIKKFKSNAKNKSKAGKASAKARRAKALSGGTGVEQTLNTTSTDEQLNINHKPLTNNHKPVIKDICAIAFDDFYSAGLVKKSKVAALKKFKALVKEMECDPMEFAELLKSDIQYRINNNQFGIDKLHPSTYLTQQRWTDEHETTKANDNGFTQGDRKLSASERIRARNEAKYGQPSSGLGMATDGGDLRGAMGQGARRITFDYVEDGS